MKESIHIFMILSIASRVLTITYIPPYITSHFASEFYLTEGSSHTFSCEATGYPKPKFEWLKDGVKIQNNQHIIVDEILGTLLINEAQREPVSDFGNYRCVASNEVGKAASIEFELKRAYIHKFQDLQPLELKVYENDYVPIQCAGKPKCEPLHDCKIEWKRGVGTASSIHESDRIAIDANGTLHVFSVTKSNQSTYTEPIACGMNHEPSKAFYKGRNVIMTVLTGTPKQYKPHVVFNANITGLLSGQAKLQCIFDGNPLPNIEWFRPNGTILSNDNQKYTFEDGKAKRNLVIKYLTEEDEGMYRCDANNVVGKTQAYLFLNVTSKPTSPEWSRNAEYLAKEQIGPSSGQKYQLSDNRTVLTIKNVQNPQDTCSIMCESGNVIIDDNLNSKFVKTYAGASLRVIVRTIFLTPSKIVSSQPEPFSMAFNASKDESVPELFLTLNFTKSDNKTFYNDNQLSKLPWVYFSSNKNNLTILLKKYNTVDDNDKIRFVAGIYSVDIFHQYDIVNLKFLVTADIEAVTEPLVESAVVDLWIIGLMLGVIVLVIVLLFIISTLYRNRGGEYPVYKKEVEAGHDPQKELKEGGFTDLSIAVYLKKTGDEIRQRTSPE